MTVRSENGEDWLFGVDTGSYTTKMDKSLEPKLGKRLGTKKVLSGWLGHASVGVYGSPKLYLGDTQLLTGGEVWTDDLIRMAPGRRMMGILGMDCLQHYCLQLDFAAGKLRFLDPDHLNGEELGKPFPLIISQTDVIIHESLMQIKGTDSGIDTGETSDGALRSELFRRALQEQAGASSKQWKDPGGNLRVIARFPSGVFAGETYSDVILIERPSRENFIGLRFLARHLVTLNFPKRTLYLKRVSIGPLVSEEDFTSAPGTKP